MLWMVGDDGRRGRRADEGTSACDGGSQHRDGSAAVDGTRVWVKDVWMCLACVVTAICNPFIT